MLATPFFPASVVLSSIPYPQLLRPRRSRPARSHGHSRHPDAGPEQEIAGGEARTGEDDAVPAD